MIISCEVCGATIIKDDKGKILVGCKHHPPKTTEYDFPEELMSIFNKK